MSKSRQVEPEKTSDLQVQTLKYQLDVLIAEIQNIERSSNT